MKTVENNAKEALKARVIDLKITSVSNYRYPITKSSNRTPVIGHPRDRAPITWQEHEEPITINNFVIDSIIIITIIIFIIIIIIIIIKNAVL